MFIKITKSKNYKYLQIVESYRENGSIKHRVLFNLGRLDLLNKNSQLANIGKKLLELTGHKVDLIDDMKEHSRVIYGHIVYRKLWDRFDFKDVILSLKKQTKINFALDEIIYYLVINRLLAPSSKKRAYERQGNYYKIQQNIQLQHIYRSLDFLSDNKEQIEKYIYNRQLNLFNIKVDVVFYDVTTFNYESNDADELRDFGFSKANKINEVQVVLGLLINSEGRPIGYELFEGNISETKTLLKSIEKISKRYKINKVVIVADKAMHSKSNLHMIRQAGYDYIVSSKIMNASSQIKEAIFDESGYHHKIDEQSGEIIYSYKDIPNKFTYKDEQGRTYEYEDRLIISWSEERAKKDYKKQQRLIQRAQKLVEGKNKTLVQKKGAKRYLKTDTVAKITALDHDKIEQDAKWHGYYAVQYSGNKLTHQQVMEQYHQLWKIEESFRIMKSTMRTRPIFHWTPKRIKGHFMLCYIAFVLERTLEIKLRRNGVELSAEQIKDHLNTLQLSEIHLNDKRFYLKSKNSSQASKILRALKIKPFKNIVEIE